MKREIIPFTTEEAWLELRLKDLTSSDTPSLFGEGYISEEELIENKRLALKLEYQMDERKQWGNALQDAIANEFARQNQWDIRKKTEYIRIPELRLGSSYDFSIQEKCGTNNEDITIEEVAGLEIKNVDYFIFKKEWITDGFDIEASPYIEIQVQHQMLVSGLEVMWIGALIGGNKGILLRREANKNVQKAILQKAEKFWKEVLK